VLYYLGRYKGGRHNVPCFPFFSIIAGAVVASSADLAPARSGTFGPSPPSPLVFAIFATTSSPRVLTPPPCAKPSPSPPLLRPRPQRPLLPLEWPRVPHSNPWALTLSPRTVHFLFSKIFRVTTDIFFFFLSELQTPIPRVKVTKADSDSEEDGEVAAKIGDLTIEKSIEAMFNESSRVSLFFTNEDNKRVSFTEDN